jgi:hypothetical protein
MRQLMYVSTSHVGRDPWALNLMTVQAGANNALHHITGLLWTDGVKFSQVIEGPPDSIQHLLQTLERDTRHSKIHLVNDIEVAERQYGSWTMQRPVIDLADSPFEQRMLRNLSTMGSSLSRVFDRVVRNSRIA